MDERDWTYIEAIDRAGIRREARRDAYTRMVQHFGQDTVDAIAASDYINTTLRRSTPHYWSPHTTTPGVPSVQPPGASKERQSEGRDLTPAELHYINGIKNPAERMTKARELRQTPVGRSAIPWPTA